MRRLAAEAQELVTVQVAGEVADRVPGERSEVCQDWTLQLLPLRRALLRLAGHLMTQAFFSPVPLQAALLRGWLRSQ